MPLVLSMKSGQDFYVGDQQVVIEKVRRDYTFDIIVTETGKRHTVTETEAVEVLDDVFVSAGDRPMAGLARVAIEAPPDVLILRGERYRNEPKPEPVIAQAEAEVVRVGSKFERRSW